MKNETNETPIENQSPKKTGRRKFIGNLGKAGISAVAVGAIAPLVDKSQTVFGQLNTNPRNYYVIRAENSYRLREEAARIAYDTASRIKTRPNNGDELLYPSRIGNFSKGLPHQSNGEVVPTAYNALLDALSTGTPSKFELIPLGGTRKLTNPQSGFAYDIEGRDAFSMIQTPPPTFASRENAAEIAENYWMALLRDVPFNDYPTNAIANAAAADLTLFGADFKGPKVGGQVTPNTLFRGVNAGDLSGPLMSQFWYLPCFFGANEVNQKIRTVKSIADGGQNYMTDFNSWLSVQNGVNPTLGDNFDSTFRYMRTGRDIGQWVHVDVLFQGYFQAFLVMAGTLGIPFDAGNPYNSSATQAGFSTFGGPHIATILCEVATRALKAVWNQKWIVHRRLRPEVFAARIHRRLNLGATYPIHPDILTSINTASRLGE